MCGHVLDWLMERLTVGLRLTRHSMRIVRSTPVLLVPALLQTAALAVLLLLLFRVSGLDTDTTRLRGMGAFASFALAGNVVGVWCGAIVVAITSDRLKGGSGDLRQGVRTANKHLPALLGWALLNTVVGTALRVLEERLGPVGRFITQGLGVVFTLGTVLVVPVLVLEGVRPVPAVRRSASLFRTKWGETVSGEVGIGLLLTLYYVGAMLLTVLPLCAAGAITAAVVTGAVLTAGLFTASALLSGVFSAALYQVATGQSDAGPFGDLTGVFPARRRVSPYAGNYDRWDVS